MRKLWARTLALIIMTTMLLSMIGAVGASAEVIENAKLKEAIQTLNALKILQGYPDGTFKPENTITRAEFSAVITRLLGLDEAVALNLGKTYFTDVPTDHWAVGNINVAYDMGIILGYGDGRFGPEDPVTYEQAVKMVVASLGYTEEAEAKGGYPNGYLASAADKGILKDALGEVGQAANRGIVAIITYNALHAQVRNPVFGSSGGSTRGGTLINERLNTERVRGQITANSDISLSGRDPVRNDEVEIDGVVYKLPESGSELQALQKTVRELLGYEVTAYVEVDKSGERVIKSITEDTNTVVTIEAPSIDEDTNKYEIIYWENEDDIRPKSLSIDNDAVVVINNKVLYNYSASDLIPEAGEVKLIDNADNGTYDVVFIKSYKTYVVQSANVATNTVTFKKIGQKTPDPLTLDPRSNDYEFIITKNNSEITIGALREWDVLAVAEGVNRRGRTLYEIIVVNNTVNGTVTEADDEMVTINNKEYKYSRNYSGETLKLNDRVKLYLDINGRIAAAELTSSVQNNYGYLKDMAFTTGVNKQVRFRIYTTSGQMRDDFKGASKIRVEDLDGSTGTYTPNELNEDIISLDSLIMYETNSRGEINAIILPKTSSGGFDENLFSLDYSKEDAAYDSGKQLFDGLYKVTSSTKKIFVPLSGDDNKFKTSYYFTNGQKYNIKIYEADRSRNAGIILIYETEGTGGSDYIADQRLIVVDKVVPATDDGEPVHKLVYYQEDSNPKELFAIDQEVLADLKTGDIIKISKNGNGRIDRINVLTPKLDGKYYVEEDKNDDKIFVAYGRINDLVGDDIEIDVGNTVDGESIFDYYKYTNAVIYKYDDKTERITTATAAELSGYEVFIRVKGSVVEDIVILNAN